MALHNWHINPEEPDTPRRCLATHHECRFKGFETRGEAFEYIAEQAELEYEASPKKSFNIRKLFVGLSLVAVGVASIQYMSDANDISATPEPTRTPVVEQTTDIEDTVEENVDNVKDAGEKVAEDLTQFKEDFTERYGDEIEGLKDLTVEQWEKLQDKVQETDWSRFDPRNINWEEYGINWDSIDWSRLDPRNYDFNMPDIQLPSIQGYDFFPDGSYGEVDSSNVASSDEILFQGKSLNPTQAEVAEAQQLLDGLTVAPENSGEGYNRKEQFGENDSYLIGMVERRDVVNAEFEDSNMGSRAIAGTYADPYTGEIITITKGDKNDTDLEHVVSLKEAYESGIAPEDMRNFARDMDNLVIVDSGANREKGSQDVGEWMPSFEQSHGRYVIENIKIKDKYNLTIDSQEKAVMQQVLNMYK